MNEITIQAIDQYLVAHLCTCQKQDRTLHMHSNACEIMLFKQGNVDYFINDTAYHLTPGDITIIRPGDIHGFFIKDETPYERIPVHIEETFAETLSSAETDLLSCFHAPQGPHLLHLTPEQMADFEIYAHAVISSREQKNFGYDIRIRSYLSLILLFGNSTLSGKQSTSGDISPRLIQEALAYINHNLTSELSIQTIADHLNISRSRLSHLFKDFTGTSLWNYIIARRIQYAQTLLRQNVSITTACYECGFKDYAHFVKVFSKINGISPGKYAKNAQDS